MELGRDGIVILERMKKVFSESRLNELGRASGHLERKREVTPWRLCLALVSGLSSNRVKSIADVQRWFNHLFDTTVNYKPFHNQLRKNGFARLLRHLTAIMMTELTLEVLRAKKGGLLKEFDDIVIQDGSSFALNDSLQKIFPGRFSTISPAAVELHSSLSLLTGSPISLTLTPDTSSERAELPRPEQLSNKLLLADRGYFNVDYLHQLVGSGASFVVRANSNINPVIKELRRVDTNSPIKHARGKHLKDISLLKRTPLNALVVWKTPDGEQFECRLVIAWNPARKHYFYLVTNLDSARYGAKDIFTAYSLRWQVEIYFKECKSYANLHAFDTSIPEIAEGFIWASLCSALFNRFFAHAAQILTKTEISTLKTANSIGFFMPNLIRALIRKQRASLRSILADFFAFLKNNATRSHTARDRSEGRLAIGILPIFALA